MKDFFVVYEGARTAQPPSGGCELKLPDENQECEDGRQPPSGGCELKPVEAKNEMVLKAQPPSGGCELKPHSLLSFARVLKQPPSGGCELKRLRCHYLADYPRSRLRAAVN